MTTTKPDQPKPNAPGHSECGTTEPVRDINAELQSLNHVVKTLAGQDKAAQIRVLKAAAVLLEISALEL